MKKVYVPKSPHDKALQRALMQWRKPQNRELVKEALEKTHRTDLIGYGKHCLIRPDKDPNAPVYKAGKLVSPGAKKPVRGGKVSTKNNKTVEPSRSDKKTAKPVRKEGWAKPKAKRTGKKYTYSASC